MSKKGINALKALIIGSILLAVLSIMIILCLKQYLNCGEVRIPVEIRFHDMK